MCGPVLSILGTVMGAANENAQYKYQAQVAEQNAALAKQQQQAAARKGAEEAAQINQEEKQTAGYQRAAMGATGVDPGYGSGLNILADTAYLAQADKSASQHNTELATWGYGVERDKYKAEASNLKKAAKMSIFTGITDTATQMSKYGLTKKSVKKIKLPTQGMGDLKAIDRY